MGMYPHALQAPAWVPVSQLLRSATTGNARKDTMPASPPSKDCSSIHRVADKDTAKKQTHKEPYPHTIWFSSHYQNSARNTFTRYARGRLESGLAPHTAFAAIDRPLVRRIKTD